MLRMSERSGKNGGLPWFNGTYRDYPAFWRKWSSYEKRHHQLTPQMELVQLFRENCMSKEIAHYIRGEETMVEAWGRLNMFNNDPLLFIRDLMQEIRASPRLKEQEYERLLRYYLLLLDLIRDADKAGH
jgi:hypothetical protein